MKRPKKQGSRRHMTPLERGLVRSARREGVTWEVIAQALHRDIGTLQKTVKGKKLIHAPQNI